MKYKKIFALVVIYLFILTQFSANITGKFESKKRINIAIILQNWDILDKSKTTRICLSQHKKCLKKYENKYNVKFHVFEFWDSYIDGNVQKGLLEKLRIDLIIAPGGFGCLYTPKSYRENIKEFVRSGGGFYGICGDSTFGSLGITHSNKKLQRIIRRIFDIDSISPMLKLANVYTDASVFYPIIDEQIFFSRINLFRSLIRLPVSRALLYFKKTNPPVQEPYFNDFIRSMMGNAPLIDGPLINRIFMSRVFTIALYMGCDKPYDESVIGKKAIIGTNYGNGRVILSSPHPELTVGNLKAQEIYVRNVLWLADALQIDEEYQINN